MARMLASFDFGSPWAGLTQFRGHDRRWSNSIVLPVFGSVGNQRPLTNLPHDLVGGPVIRGPAVGIRPPHDAVAALVDRARPQPAVTLRAVDLLEQLPHLER